jgi:hypothetical protein
VGLHLRLVMFANGWRRRRRRRGRGRGRRGEKKEHV